MKTYDILGLFTDQEEIEIPEPSQTPLFTQLIVEEEEAVQLRAVNTFPAFLRKVQAVCNNCFNKNWAMPAFSCQAG